MFYHREEYWIYRAMNGGGSKAGASIGTLLGLMFLFSIKLIFIFAEAFCFILKKIAKQRARRTSQSF